MIQLLPCIPQPTSLLNCFTFAVCDFGYATEDLVDKYNHVINTSSPFIKVC